MEHLFEMIHHMMEPIAPLNVLFVFFVFFVAVDGAGLNLPFRGPFAVFVAGIASPFLDSFGIILAQAKTLRWKNLFDTSAVALVTGILTPFGELWALPFFIIASRSTEMTPVLFPPVALYFLIILANNIRRNHMHASAEIHVEVHHDSHQLGDENSVVYWIAFAFIAGMMLLKVPEVVVFGFTLLYLLVKNVRIRLLHGFKQLGFWMSLITIMVGLTAYFSGVRLETIAIEAGLPVEIVIFVASCISGPAAAFLMPVPVNDAQFVQWLFIMAAGVVLSPSGGIVNLLVLKDGKSWFGYITTTYKYSMILLAIAWIYPMFLK